MNSQFRITAAVLAAMPLFSAVALGDNPTANGATRAHAPGPNRAAPHKHPPHGSKTIDTHEIESVKLTFQKIAVTNVVGSKSASDDWTTSSTGSGKGHGKHHGKGTATGKIRRPGG